MVAMNALLDNSKAFSGGSEDIVFLGITFVSFSLSQIIK